MDDKAIQTCLKLISKDFSLDTSQWITNDKDATYHIIHKLAQLVQHLRDRDMNTLLNALYRIDVNEHKVKEILAHAPIEKMAPSIAVLIFEREKEKTILRQKYNNKI